MLKNLSPSNFPIRIRIMADAGLGLQEIGQAKHYFDSDNRATEADPIPFRTIKEFGGIDNGYCSEQFLMFSLISNINSEIQSEAESHKLTFDHLEFQGEMILELSSAGKLKISSITIRIVIYHPSNRLLAEQLVQLALSSSYINQLLAVPKHYVTQIINT